MLDDAGPVAPSRTCPQNDFVEYVSRAPARPLDRFVDDVYCLTGSPRHRRLNVPPMPSAHLMVNLGGPVRLYDSAAALVPYSPGGGWFMGVWSRRFAVEHAGPVHLVGVHFKPWGVSPFVGVPVTELRDRWVPADAIWGASFGRLRERLGAASSVGETLQFVEAELRSRLLVAAPRGLRLVTHTAGRIAASWGALPVGVLSDGAGVSGNHLAAQFREHVGLNPKRVARIYRFARVVLSIDAARPVDWSRLAQDAGYVDQAHLGKEFKDFSGHTPTGYLALRRRFPAERDFPPDNGPIPVE